MSTLPTCLIQLESSNSGNYEGQFAEQVLYQKLKGGAGRYRLDLLNSTHLVSVAVNLSPQAYRYWKAFYRQSISYGSLPFQVQLILESDQPTLHTVNIIPGSMKLARLAGLSYTLQMTLEVTPDEPDDLDDTAAITAGPGY